MSKLLAVLLFHKPGEFFAGQPSNELGLILIQSRPNVSNSLPETLLLKLVKGFPDSLRLNWFVTHGAIT